MNGFTRILPITVAIVAACLAMAAAAAQTVDGQFPILVMDVSESDGRPAEATHDETAAQAAPQQPENVTVIVYDRICDPITGTCRLVPRRVAAGVRNVVDSVTNRCQCGCNRAGCRCSSQQVTVNVRRARFFRLRR